MSRDFIPSLPEHLQGIYKNALVEPSPMKISFTEQNRVQALKNKLRETSNLYKIFGEDMFGFTVADGSLNLDIAVLDHEDFINELSRENLAALSIEFMLRVNEQAFEEKQYIPITAPTRDGGTAVVRFNSEEVLKACSDEFKDTHDAIDRVKAIRDTLIGKQSVDEDGHITYADKSKKTVYLNNEHRTDIRGIRKMMEEISNRTLSTHNFFYMRYSVVRKPLDRSMAIIHWPRELYSLV